MNLPLFSIQPVLGKGKGLVARFNVEKGKRILSEKPLFITSNWSSMSQMESNLAAKLKALSKTEQRQFLSLHNNFPGKHPFSGIVRTNALPCGPDSEIGGVYPTICLINHSCLPNAHNSWNIDTECETIHAIRFIKEGKRSRYLTIRVVYQTLGVLISKLHSVLIATAVSASFHRVISRRATLAAARSNCSTKQLEIQSES